MITLAATEWAGFGYQLRQTGIDDHAFQRALFGLCRPDACYLALWPRQQRDAFLDLQFALQDLHYRQHFGGADRFIILKDATPVGRLIVDRGSRRWRIVDVGLMPDHRGHGLGTALLVAVQEACAAAGARTLDLQVEPDNRARSLYTRRAFVETGNTGTHLEMRWNAAGQLKTAS